MTQQSDWDVSVEDLKKLKDDGAEFQLIDVREPSEVEVSHIDGLPIPLASLPERLAELDADAHIVVHCKSGGRSARAVELMRAQGFSNSWNLQGGLIAWIERIDPTLPLG